MSKSNNTGQSGLNRRQFIKAGGAATAASAAGLLVPGLFLPSRSSWAAESYPALGNYPAGVQGDSVLIGVTVPLTGPYSASGEDEKRGYELAISQINGGDAIAQKWGLKGKGVLGKMLKHKVADSQTKPNPAVQAQVGFIQQDKAIMISGCVSSATAVALEKLAQREKVINMVGASGSNATTGEDCQRYGFRSQHPAYMMGKALAPVLAKHVGKDKKVAYLVPDYTFGHTVFNSVSEFTGKQGWKVVSKQLAPLGTTDFSSFLINIANSGADVFVNIAFGGDSVVSTKQAAQFGILKKMKLVVPLVSPFEGEELGPEYLEGVYGTMEWHWRLAEHYPLSKDFLDSFRKAYKDTPRWTAHIAYMQTYLWALAVEHAGTFYPVKVIKALESMTFENTTLGKVRYQDYDHQLARPVPVMLGKSKAEMKGKDDYFKVVEVVPGEDLRIPEGTLGCKLGSYT